MITRSVFLEKGFNQVIGEEDSNYMTLSGTINKMGILLAIVLISSLVSFIGFNNNMDKMVMIIIVTAIGGSIIGLITSFIPKISPITSPLYAILEGLFLGGLSSFMETMIPGIVVSAIIATIISAFCVFAYLKFNPNSAQRLMPIIIISTMSLAMIFLFDMILGFFGFGIPLLNSSGPIGIAIDLIVILIAAGNLLLDFHFIRERAELGAPKYMEWYSSFGVLVTLILMYTKILELLYKLRGRNSFED